MKNLFLWLWNGEDVGLRLGMAAVAIFNLLASDGFTLPAATDADGAVLTSVAYAGAWLRWAAHVIVAGLTALMMRPKPAQVVRTDHEDRTLPR